MKNIKVHTVKSESLTALEFQVNKILKMWPDWDIVDVKYSSTSYGRTVYSVMIIVQEPLANDSLQPERIEAVDAWKCGKCSHFDVGPSRVRKHGYSPVCEAHDDGWFRGSCPLFVKRTWWRFWR